VMTAQAATPSLQQARPVRKGSRAVQLRQCFAVER